MPMSNQPSSSDQGRRPLGPAALRTCPLALLLSQVRARLGSGGYCRHSGNGGPQTCLPAACGVAQRRPSTAHLHQHKLKTLARGQASRGGRCKASSGAASPGRLVRRRRDQGRGTSRGAHDTSHDDQDQAGASLRSVLISSLVQRGKAQARSTEASGKGFHIGTTRPRPAEWQDGGHRGAQDGIITSAFGSGRPPLVRIACTSCPLSKWPLLAPFPLNIWEEDQGLYM